MSWRPRKRDEQHSPPPAPINPKPLMMRLKGNIAPRLHVVLVNQFGERPIPVLEFRAKEAPHHEEWVTLRDLDGEPKTIRADLFELV